MDEGLEWIDYEAIDETTLFAVSQDGSSFYEGDQVEEEEEEVYDDEYDDDSMASVSESGFEEEEESADEEVYEEYEAYDEDNSNKEEISKASLEEEAMANAIIASIQGAIPTVTSLKSEAPIRMTDLGFKISQMVILKNQRAPVEEEVNDVLLEKQISGKRRNKTGIRGRPKKVDFGFGRSTTVKLSPEVAKLMGKANIAFVQRQYDEAIRMLEEVIRHSSSSFEPYHTLGLIYEEMGHLEKAFSYFLISAHLSKGDLELWNKLTMLAVKLGRRRETIYCLSKVLFIGKISDPRPFWVRSRLYLELESYSNVILSFADLFRRRLDDIDLFQSIAQLALRINLSYDAAKLFSKLFTEALSIHSNKVAMITWSHLNLLLEMYLASKNYDGMILAIERFSIPLYNQSKRTLSTGALLGEVSFDRIVPELPMDIRVKLAIAYVHQRVARLPYDLEDLSQQLDVENLADLRLSLGDAYKVEKRYEVSLQFYLPLIGHPSVILNIFLSLFILYLSC